MDTEHIKKAVRERYGKFAKESSSCCGHSTSCCGDSVSPGLISKAIGYSNEEINDVPEDSNLGLGCGNPTAIASLKEGETVLDLGSGAGFDCFLAANQVGKSGKVIGVDMTWDMLEKARANAKKGSYQNVEFRLGEIEHLPVGDNSVDVIISNCVINLSIDKKQVFSEAFRVLKPGGRLMVSDIVLLKSLPEFILGSIEAYGACLAGALLKDEYLGIIKGAGFGNIEIHKERGFPVELMFNDPTIEEIISKYSISKRELLDIGNSFVSITVSGYKK